MFYQLLSSFWEWIGCSEIEYSKKQHPDLEEYMYPQWTELLECAKLEIMKCNTEKQSVDAVLDVLALDNEREELLDYIEENASDDYIDILCKLGLSHKQSNSRWQIAELLGRRDIKKNDLMLSFLLKDHDYYVRKRALNVLTRTGKSVCLVSRNYSMVR